VSVDPDSDFGYSYGVLESSAGSPPSSRASYVRVWRRDGPQWRVAIDMRTPLATDDGR
jgi:hypothetical protein